MQRVCLRSGPRSSLPRAARAHPTLQNQPRIARPTRLSPFPSVAPFLRVGPFPPSPPLSLLIHWREEVIVLTRWLVAGHARGVGELRQVTDLVQQDVRRQLP